MNGFARRRSNRRRCPVPRPSDSLFDLSFTRGESMQSERWPLVLFLFLFLFAFVTVAGCATISDGAHDSSHPDDVVSTDDAATTDVPAIDVPAGRDVGAPADVSDVARTDTGPITAGAVGATGGTVDLLHFSAFGDVRPPNNNDTTGYPTAVINAVMTGMQSLGTQFAVASGDYMFATTSTAVTAQVGLFVAAERGYANHIFHGMGNHECNGAVLSNCPLGTETPNVSTYLSRLNPAYGGHPYFDWVVHTRLGDAHFIATAPNAWSVTQQTWLRAALAQAALYTIVVAHEPPDAIGPPAGTAAIESLIATRAGGITLRLYGHTHEYRHLQSPDYNAVVDGNAGAPFSGGYISGQYYGFGVVDQRADGNIVFTAYQTGSPPMVMDSWVVAPNGARSR